MSLVRLDDPGAAERWCAAARARGERLGFVPTMGALHAGHRSLVRRACDENEHAVVSVFVNPLQFDDPRDFERYPRDLEADAALLAGSGARLLFTGTLEQFFPERAALRDPGPDALGLEGEFRPGHFAGVATICARLFELVRPARAYFGEKDYQQCRVVQHVARELGFPEIVPCATVREKDGLALSSRNRLLTPPERAAAQALPRALFAARAAWSDGERDAARLEGRLRAELAVPVVAGPGIVGPGIVVEYAELRDPARFAERTAGRLVRARALVAARVGRVRLIDNLDLAGDGPALDAAERA